MVLVLALGAACCYATAGVLQQRSAQAQPFERALRPTLLLHLVAERQWLAGVAADGLGYLLQFLALERGSLVLVQPLLVSGLLFALPLSAFLARRRMTPLDWAGSFEVVVGLSLFLVMARPAQGRATTTATGWAIVLAGTLVPAVVLVAVARRRRGQIRAVFLGTAAGIAFGLTAALTKTNAHLLDHGLGQLVSSWQLYAMVVIGVWAMLVAQSAFQAGALSLSLPVMTVTDPVVSIVIGAAVFEEGIARRGLEPALQLLGLVAMVAGVFTLARAEQRSREGAPAQDRPSGEAGLGQ